MTDRRWLTRRDGQTWHCVIGVPRKLQPFVIGRTGKPMRHLIKSLHTTDLAVARQRRWHVLAEFRDIIARAGGTKASPDLISADKDRLKSKAKADLQDAFPGGGQATSLESTRQRFENRTLADLNLYDH